MNLTNLTSAHFKQVIALLDKKETLQAQIIDLDHQVTGLLGGKTAGGQTGGRGRKAGPTAKRGAVKRGGRRRKAGAAAGSSRRGGGKRGALKESIINELKSAGDEGISIKQLAAKLDVKTANLHAWFGSTGKKLAGLKKVGPAKYQLTAANGADE